MADSLLLATLVLFITGLLLSTAVTYRDCLAFKRIEGAMRQRQCILVFSDVVQIGFFSFGIASIIQDRPARVGLSIAWALQCMTCTNVRSSMIPLSDTVSSVYTHSSTHLFKILVAACSSSGAGAIRRGQQRDGF